jgi:hypothetical protein
MPEEIELHSLKSIDRSLTDMDDRPMIIALHQLGFDGLATNNYKILNVATEVAALIATKLTFICTEGMGNNAVRATGALLLELPGLTRRVRPKKENIFHLRHPFKQPTDAWPYIQKIAKHQGWNPGELYREHIVSDAELTTPVLRSGS